MPGKRQTLLTRCPAKTFRLEVTPSPALPPFQDLLDAHGPDVHRFLVALVGRVDADDCHQETWLAALRAYPRVCETSNLRGWILTIAHHKALDHFRSARRRAVPVADVPEPQTSAVEHSQHSGVASGRPDQDLWAQVRELPPKQRTALALRYVADAAYAEISSVMGTSEAAARRSVHEGLKRLRTEYTP